MNWVSIGSGNGLSPGRRQAIIWNNAGLLSIGPLGTSFSEIRIEIQNFSFTKMHLKILSAKWQPFCPGGDEFRYWHTYCRVTPKINQFGTKIAISGLAWSCVVLKTPISDVTCYHSLYHDESPLSFSYIASYISLKSHQSWNFAISVKMLHKFAITSLPKIQLQDLGTSLLRSWKKQV